MIRRMTVSEASRVKRAWSENRLGLDYRAEAERLGPPPAPIIDVHTHIHGLEAAKVYAEARRLYGVTMTYSMSTLRDAPGLLDLFGDSIRFIVTPEFGAQDRRHAHTIGFLEAIDKFHALGARILKFWAAPRSRDYGREAGDPTLLSLDNEWRQRAMELGASLGMMFMVHIGDPDTWFQTKYTDDRIYGTKAQQYEPFERAMERYRHIPWLAAHFGGWPEDLEFLDGLLSRHSNLYLDTSATKWMVRELSRYSRGDFIAFMERWRGRILFGSDIVTMDGHLTTNVDPTALKADQAGSPEEAFELYASRHWALRTLFETEYDGESPIADGDLALVAPERFDAMSAPRLRGKAVPADLLRVMYHEAAMNLHEKWHREHP